MSPGVMLDTVFKSILILVTVLEDDFRSQQVGFSCFVYFENVKLEFRWRFPLNYGKLRQRLTGLRQLLTTESHLKMMKNAFHFT